MSRHFILSLVLAAFALPASASYYQNSCSTGHADVRFAEGHEEMGVFLTYVDEESGQRKVKEFDFESVQKQFLRKRTISRVNNRSTCSFEHTYQGRVRLTPTTEVAEEFKKIYPSGSVTVEVICLDALGFDECK